MNPWWQQLLLVMAGGALGAGGRHLLGGWLLRTPGGGFPWGTLVVNLAGSLAAGFLLVWLQQRGPAALMWRAFLLVGVIGALTTWSALMIELYAMHRTGPFWLGTAYLLASLLGSLALLVVGMRMAEYLR
jgi:fluoride exporter